MERGDGTSVEHRMRELEQLAPDHPLTLWARRSLAVRNGDPYAIRACSEQLLERFPDDVNAELSVLDCLASIGTTAEQEQRILHHLEKPKPPWIYYERLAQLLSANAEELPRARSSVRKAHRYVPLRGATIGLWASLERDAGSVELSLCLRRAAATLEPTSDELARAYFEDSYRSGDCQSALELLHDRVQRYRARSAEPLYVLFGALEWLDREREAFAELELGLERRPDDGQLLLFAANAHARYGRIEPGRALLERARGHVDPALFEQNAARIAELSGDLADALARYRAVLEAQPLSLRAHDAVADLCAQLHGLDEARRQLERACAQYPSHIGLRELYVHRLRGHDPTQVLAQLHVLLEQQPLHGWAKRERALVLSDLGEHERAIEEARHAVQLAPNHPSSQRILAGVLSASGRRTEALSAARKAVELWCDGPGTVSELLRLAGSLDEQLALARWCGDHVGEKSLDGIGLLEWHAFVIDILPRAELTAIAGRVHERRPNLWASQLLLARELNAAGQSDSAERLLMSACERFSVPRLQLELAGLRRTRGDVEGEARGLAAALRANPSWLEAILRAAGSLQYATDPDSARRILEKGLRFHPRSSALLLATARLEFKHGRVASALSCARQAVENQPEEAEGWALYASYARQLERAEDVGVLAHELTRQRPWNARIWLRLADVRALEAENLATIAALREALARDPDLPEAHDELAQALTRIGKRDEALQACEARMTNYAARGGLRARRAWVLWQFQAFDEACAEMRQVVTDHPDQLWGLQELVGWELEREKPAAAVELAQALVERAPLRCVAHGYLGQALLAAKDEEAAWEALTQASRLDPTYAYAGGRRVELAILRRHYADAEGVIAEQGEHVPVNTRDAWRLSLACARGRTREAMQLLLGMAERPTTSVEDLTIASQALPRLPVHELKPALTELARDPRTHAALGAIWVDTLRRVESAPSCIAVLRLRRHHSQAFMSALVAHFEALGDASTGFWRLLPSLVVLGLCAWGSDVAWGKVGYALARARAYAVCELWLSDYQRRSSIEAWMLQNLKLCALENHRFGAALRASEYALKLPTDVTLPQHLAFVAFGRATAGDLDAAREVVEGRSGSELSGGDWKLFEASRLLVKFAAAPEEERAVLLVELRALDFTASHLGGLDPLSGGVLQRRFAAGVLRQHFSSWFWLTRWMPLLCGLILLAAATLSPEKSGLRDLTISWSIIAACVALFLRWRA
jgi:tetratricopeptide (TPR) repeat protein